MFSPIKTPMTPKLKPAAGHTPVPWYQIESMFTIVETKLAQRVLQAISDRDSKTIFELGSAVEFLKHWKPQGDNTRSLILHFKFILNRDGGKMTIRELATKVGFTKEEASTGFSRLRRLCKELDFPLAPTRQISYLRTIKSVDHKKNKKVRQHSFK